VLAIDQKQDLLSIAVEKNQIERSSSPAALTSSTTKWKVFESLLHHAPTGLPLFDKAKPVLY
jgi:hypothetical protein